MGRWRAMKKKGGSIFGGWQNTISLGFLYNKTQNINLITLDRFQWQLTNIREWKHSQKEETADIVDVRHETVRRSLTCRVR